MKKWGVLIAVIVVVLAIAGWLFKAYNGFVQLNENVSTQWAQVENQFQRRYDLIPNLVETVKGIAEQEQTVFIDVTEARSKVGQMNIDESILSNPDAFASFQAAQDQLSGALSRLLVAVESYPELKSAENFLALQNQLEGTENRIAVERGRFNDVVREYNVRAKGIPGKWLASWFGFDAEKQLFESVQGSEVPPKVDFNLGGEESVSAPEMTVEILPNGGEVPPSSSPAMGAVD